MGSVRTWRRPASSRVSSIARGRGTGRGGGSRFASVGSSISLGTTVDQFPPRVGDTRRGRRSRWRTRPCPGLRHAHRIEDRRLGLREVRQHEAADHRVEDPSRNGRSIASAAANGTSAVRVAGHSTWRSIDRPRRPRAQLGRDRRRDAGARADVEDAVTCGHGPPTPRGRVRARRSAGRARVRRSPRSVVGAPVVHGQRVPAAAGSLGPLA